MSAFRKRLERLEQCRREQPAGSCKWCGTEFFRGGRLCGACLHALTTWEPTRRWLFVAWRAKSPLTDAELWRDVDANFPRPKMYPWAEALMKDYPGTGDLNAEGVPVGVHLVCQVLHVLLEDKRLRELGLGPYTGEPEAYTPIPEPTYAGRPDAAEAGAEADMASLISYEPPAPVAVEADERTEEEQAALDAGLKSLILRVVEGLEDAGQGWRFPGIRGGPKP
jgi:hypothetical protein